MFFRSIAFFGFWAVLSFPLVAQEIAKPDIQGEVTKVFPGTDVKKTGIRGSILVEAPKDKKFASDKAVIRITAKTKLEKQVGKERKPATFEDLKLGQQVQATFSGPVAESYPVQATAKEIFILSGEKNK